MKVSCSRRNFLKVSSAFCAGAVSAPLILPRSLFGADAPSKKLNMGFIGMGRQSHGLLGGFLGSAGVRVLAVCDVDSTRRKDAKERVDRYYSDAKPNPGACAAYTDFGELIARKDIDAVCIATPDHWHAIVTLAALRSGRDVYCEKPLTHNIHEAISVMRAVDVNGRVLQTGSMQRSMKEFRVACELVLNGVIGQVERVECSFGDPGVPCDLGGEPIEPGLDWDRWLGPAPVRAYNSILSPRGLYKYYPHWRSYREFGGGMVTDWGAHHLDIAQWGLGMDASGPVEILPPEKPNAKRGARLVYANGVTVEHKDGFGVHFYGSEGEVLVNRGKFVCKKGSSDLANFTNHQQQPDTNCALEVAKAEGLFLKNPKVRLYASSNHLTDFLSCVKSRKKPITSEQVGARSAICCHLMNQAYYHGQKLEWDPARLQFRGGTGDAAWLTREYRKPWVV
jgi:predicted dehydrogenase